MPFLTPSQGLLPARAGSPLAGRVSHPLDDTQSFMKVSPPPIPFDQPCLVALMYLSARLAFTMAAFNVLVQWHGVQPNAAGFVPLSIAEFSL